MLKPSVKPVKVTEYVDPETGERYPSIQEANEAIVIREATSQMVNLLLNSYMYTNSSNKRILEGELNALAADIVNTGFGLKLYDALKKYFD